MPQSEGLSKYILSHMVRRNLAIGTPYDYKLTDLLYAYDNDNKRAEFEKWTEMSLMSLKAMLINTKCMALVKIIKILRSSEDIDQKRGYLLDAMRLEREINELIYGGDD